MMLMSVECMLMDIQTRQSVATMCVSKDIVHRSAPPWHSDYCQLPAAQTIANEDAIFFGTILILPFFFFKGRLKERKWSVCFCPYYATPHCQLDTYFRHNVLI